MSLVVSDIPEEELLKLRFILKLWIVTNDTSHNYLRWNRDETVLIANLCELRDIFCTDASNIFMCKTIEQFIFLMYKHAFETRTSSQVLEESERSAIAPECMLFVHPQFIGSNAPVFEVYLSSPALRMHEIGQKGGCTLPYKLQFMVKESIQELAEARMRALSLTNYLHMKLFEPMRGQESVSIEIPQAFVDYQVMDVPDYFNTKEIEGYYGPVSVNELKKCLGNVLPTPCMDLTNEEHEDTTEEIEVVEIPGNETLEDNDAILIVQEPAAISTETSAILHFNNLRELYENANAWTDSEGHHFEYHEIYEIDREPKDEVNVKHDCVEEGDENTAESTDNVLPALNTAIVPKMEHEIHEKEGEVEVKIEDVDEADENAVECMPEYLTKSIQACLPALDFD